MFLSPLTDTPTETSTSPQETPLPLFPSLSTHGLLSASAAFTPQASTPLLSLTDGRHRRRLRQLAAAEQDGEGVPAAVPPVHLYDLQRVVVEVVVQRQLKAVALGLWR